MTDATRTAEPRHPIGFVAERTGLSQDVLRVWERRYSAVSPGRGVGGQRLYSDADIDRLRLLALATGAGRSIGQVAALPTVELEIVVRESGAPPADARVEEPTESARHESLVSQAVERARAFDANSLEGGLRSAAAVLGAHQFLECVAAPLVRRLAHEGRSGLLTAAQRQLGSAAVHRVVVALTYTFPPAIDAPSVVVATVTGERNELGAILAAASATAQGWRVIYLGADLPGCEIGEAAVAVGARAVAVSAERSDDEDAMVVELDALRDRLPTRVESVVVGECSIRVVGRTRSPEWLSALTLRDFRSALRGITVARD